MAKLMRGTCPECGREYALTAAGTMRSHLPKKTLRKLIRGQCKGSNRPPLNGRCW